jgi:hypothetical protein
MTMTKEELITFLKENLRIECEKQYGRYGASDTIEVKLFLGDDELSDSSFDFPTLR